MTRNDSTVPVATGGLEPRRIVRLLLPAVVIALVYLAWELVPTFLSLLWVKLPRGFRQGLVVGVLDGLLIAYGVVLFAVVLGLLVVVGVLARSQGRFLRRPWLARLVLLELSLLIGLAGLEGVSSIWLRWLHRSPALPPVQRDPVEDSLPKPGKAQAGEAKTPGGPLRIVVIGESSARGEPYHPWLSVGQIVGWQLETVFPGRSILVDMQAEGGATLEETHQKLAALTYRPDALVLFAGHNEFQGRWSWSRNFPYYVDERKPELSPLELAVRRSPFCSLIVETLDVQCGQLCAVKDHHPGTCRPTYLHPGRASQASGRLPTQGSGNHGLLRVDGHRAGLHRSGLE